MNRIKVKIHPDGRVDLELNGFAGLSCLDTTRSLENLLGDEIIKRTINSESTTSYSHPHGTSLKSN